MKNYENQSWIEGIPLFAFREYLGGRTEAGLIARCIDCMKNIKEKAR